MTITLAPAVPAKAANYRQISGPDGLLANLQPFTGNSLHSNRVDGGRWIDNGRMPSETRVPADAIYVVWSYGTPVAWVTADGTVTVPDHRYSVTTSKGQGYCRAWLGAAVIGTSTNARHISEGYRTH
jgi:hypothetical protein